MLDPMIPPQPHHLEAERAYVEIARNLTPAQQLATLHSLQQSAWALKTSLLQSEHPELSEEEIQQMVRDSFLYAAP
jgi:hypothetical protein